MKYKNLLKKAIVSCLLVPCIASAKESVPDAAEAVEKVAEVDLSKIKHAIKPMLWKVEKKGMTKPSWLFGTVHVSDKRVVNLHPASQKAFDQAQRFYAEVDMSVAGQMKSVQTVMREDGKSMSDSIGKELTKKLNTELSLINPMFSMEVFNPMKTWVMVITLPMLGEMVEGKPVLDIQLWNKSEAAGKKVAPLETYEEQSRGLNALTEAEQVEFLKITLDGLAKARAEKVDPIKEVVDVYLKGEEKEFEEYLNKSMKDETIPKALSDKMIKGLLTDRNIRMANNIDKALTKFGDETHFFAVGSAHYIGKGSICEVLKEKGYTITRVLK